MASLTTAFLVALGVCAWLYPKIYNRTGGANNNKQAYLTLGLIGLVIFAVLELFLGLFL